MKFIVEISDSIIYDFYMPDDILSGDVARKIAQETARVDIMEAISINAIADVDEDAGTLKVTVEA